MSVQSFFNYQFDETKDNNNFFVNSTNENAYNFINNFLFDHNIFLYGPKNLANPIF